MTGASTGAKRSRLADRGLDLYETPGEAVRALLAREPVPLLVWEPACGPGAIVRELRAAGRFVYASDLADYGAPMQAVQGWPGRDFLFERAGQGAPEVAAIVTNPPYMLATEFVEHAMRLAPMGYFLLRTAFLESERRQPLFASGMLARVLIFANRLPMMHRADWDGPRSTSTQSYAWFVFDRNHAGLPTVDWLDSARYRTPEEADRLRAEQREERARRKARKDASSCFLATENAGS